MKNQPKTKTHVWITFIGVMLLLIGIYASVKTGVNITMFEKYPQTGVLNLNFSGTPTYNQQEKDCGYPQSYYTNDGKPRAATKEEKANEATQKQICIEGVKEARNQAKINDVSQSILFLFLGLGVLVTRKIFFQ